MLSIKGNSPQFFSHIWDWLLIFLVCGIAVTNYFWLKIDRYPVTDSDVMVLSPAAQVYREIIGLPNCYRDYDCIWGLYYPDNTNYPPLAFLSAVVFFILFGLQGKMALMITSLYSSIALMSIYGVGKYLFNAQVGFFSAFVLSSFQGYISQSRMCSMEFPILAYTCLSQYLLLKSNFFCNRKYSILLGMCLGVSLLYKHESIIFVWCQLLFILFAQKGLSGETSKPRWTFRLSNFFLTIALFLTIFSSWALPYIRKLVERAYVVVFTNIDSGAMQNLSLIENMSFYSKMLSSYLGNGYILLFIFIIFFGGISMIQKKKRYSFSTFFLPLWFAVPYFILAMIKVKYETHSLPLLAPLALFIASGITYFKNKLSRLIFIIIIICHGLTLHSFSFRPLVFFPQQKFYTFINTMFAKLGWEYGKNTHRTFYLPWKDPVETSIYAMLDFIRGDARQKECPVVLSLPQSPALRNRILSYYNLVGDYRLNLPGCMRLDDFLVDYVVLETKNLLKIPLSSLLNSGYFLSESVADDLKCRNIPSSAIDERRFLLVKTLYLYSHTVYVLRKK